VVVSILQRSWVCSRLSDSWRVLLAFLRTPYRMSELNYVLIGLMRSIPERQSLSFAHPPHEERKSENATTRIPASAAARQI
jgi:hypothetical protein